MGRKTCVVPGCKKERASQRRYCATHRNRREREKNPVSYYYSILKANAKKRGIEFGLTVEEFRDFCNRTGYLLEKGNDGNSLTIDRIDPNRGYYRDNIQALSRSENSSKQFRDEEDEFPDTKDAPF